MTKLDRYLDQYQHIKDFPRKHPAQKKKKYWIDKNDDLFSIYTRKRYPICLRCGNTGYATQCSHVKSRGKKTLRWNPRNAIGLCAGCHMWWHSEPSESGPWYAMEFPNDLTYLDNVLRQGDPAPTLYELIDIYVELLKMVDRVEPEDITF